VGQIWAKPLPAQGDVTALPTAGVSVAGLRKKADKHRIVPRRTGYEFLNSPLRRYPLGRSGLGLCAAEFGSCAAVSGLGAAEFGSCAAVSGLGAAVSGLCAAVSGLGAAEPALGAAEPALGAAEPGLADREPPLLPPAAKACKPLKLITIAIEPDINFLIPTLL